MPIVPGLWLANPHKVGTHKKRRKRHKARSRRRKNIGNLTFLNKGGSMAVHRRKRRKAKAHRRRKRSYAKRRYSRKASSYTPRRRRRYRHRRKHYAKNPKRYRVRRRRHGRRRNPSARSLVRRTYGTASSLFSMGMAKNVIAGMAGFFSLKYIEGYIPWQPSSFVGGLLKKGLAAVGAYTLAGFIPGVSRSMKRYVLYGSAFSIGLDLLQYLPAASAGITEATKLSGYSGYGQGSLDVPAVPSRLLPTAMIAPVMQ